jgi:hypothetical protein
LGAKKGNGKGLVFIHIATKEKFEGEFPDKVYAIHSKTKNGMTVTMAEDAVKGDENYEKVLVAYMFMNGYITEERIR